MFIPKFIIPDLRTNHAGETGAVYIYKGILTVTKDPELINFSKRHLKTEESHLDLINKIIPEDKKSKILIIWKFMGFLTGFLPALFGTRFVFATIYYVETFVEKHYKRQILSISNNKSYTELKSLLEKLKNDEENHKEEALYKIKKFNLFIKIWGKIVDNGSKIAVLISYKI